MINVNPAQRSGNNYFKPSSSYSRGQGLKPPEQGSASRPSKEQVKSVLKKIGIGALIVLTAPISVPILAFFALQLIGAIFSGFKKAAH
jgi:hypothetical protein